MKPRMKEDSPPVEGDSLMTPLASTSKVEMKAFDCGRECEKCRRFLSFKLYRQHQLNGCSGELRLTSTSIKTEVCCPICEDRSFLDQRSMVDHVHTTHGGGAPVETLKLHSKSAILDLIKFMQRETGIGLVLNKSSWPRMHYCCAMIGDPNLNVTSCTAFLETTKLSNGGVLIEMCNSHTHSVNKNVAIFSKETRRMIADMEGCSAVDIAKSIRGAALHIHPNKRTDEEKSMLKITPYQVIYCNYLNRTELLQEKEIETQDCENDNSTSFVCGACGVSNNINIEDACELPEYSTEEQLADEQDLSVQHASHTRSVDEINGHLTFDLDAEGHMYESIKNETDEQYPEHKQGSGVPEPIAMKQEIVEEPEVQEQPEALPCHCAVVPHEWISFFKDFDYLRNGHSMHNREARSTISTIWKSMDSCKQLLEVAMQKAKKREQNEQNPSTQTSIPLLSKRGMPTQSDHTPDDTCIVASSKKLCFHPFEDSTGNDFLLSSSCVKEENETQGDDDYINFADLNPPPFDAGLSDSYFGHELDQKATRYS